MAHALRQRIKSSVDIVFLSTFFLLFLLLLLRTVSYQSLDEPMSESFSYLLLGALENRYAITRPILDGYFFLPRILAGLAVTLNPMNAGVLLALFAIAFHALTASWIVRREFEQILPKMITRFFLALYIALGPGSIEIAGHGICISYTATILSCLLAVNPSEQFRKSTLLAILLLSLSSNFGAIALPVYIARIFWKVSIDSIFAALVIFCSGISTIVLVLRSADNLTALLTISKSEMITTHSVILILRKMLHGIDPLSMSYFTVLTIVFLLVAFCVKIKKMQVTENWILGIGLIAVAFLFVMTHALARSYDMGSLFSRHAALMFIPLVIGLAISFRSSKNGIGYDGIIFVLVIPVILLPLFWPPIVEGRTQARVVWRSASWSQFVSDSREMLQGKEWSVFIGPFRDFEEGLIPYETSKCKKHLNTLECQVEFKHEKERSYHFRTP